MSAIVACSELRFQYPNTGFALHVPTFELQAGQTVFLQGNSGSGKSTFLNLLAGVLKPQQGTVVVMERNLGGLSSVQCDRLRVDHMGFLFQQFNLLNYLSVLDNVCLPCEFSAHRRKKALQRYASIQQAAQDLLNELGLGHTLDHPVHTLSVGQQQRVAAARALIGQPDVIIADEPTSALDETHRDAFMRLLLQHIEQQYTALILVSHDARLAAYCQRTEQMSNWHCSHEEA